jgi:ATP-dependent exoDNAse (exonuclease V) alpha subunit
VAYFFMQISSVARSAGRRATASAAYRAGERLRDERSGRVHNFTHRRDVLHTELLLPGQYAESQPDWARERERLWNMAERAEKRYSARVAREYQVALPAELSAPQRIALARTFAREVSERYRVVVDLAVHAPRPGSDPRHFHAHLLTTTREVTPAGLGAKAGLDLSARERARRGLSDHRSEYLHLRERWATLTNDALRAAHVDARIDHRSLSAQGIDREPLPRIPLAHLKMEQRGLRSEVAERIRSEHRRRVDLRQERSLRAGAGTAAAETPRRDLEQVRSEARQAWLALRRQASGERAATKEHAAEAAPQAEDDLAL